MGTTGAVNAYMRSWLVWWDVPNSQWMIPVFPGGATGRPRAHGEPDRRPAHPARGHLEQGRPLARPPRAHPLRGRRVRLRHVPGRVADGHRERPDRELHRGAGPGAGDHRHDRPGLGRGLRHPQRAPWSGEGTVAIPGTPAHPEGPPVRPERPAAEPHALRPALAGHRRRGDGRHHGPGPAGHGRQRRSTRAPRFVEPIAGGRSYGTWLVSQGLGRAAVLHPRGAHLPARHAPPAPVPALLGDAEEVQPRQVRRHRDPEELLQPGPPRESRAPARPATSSSP